MSSETYRSGSLRSQWSAGSVQCPVIVFSTLLLHSEVLGKVNQIKETKVIESNSRGNIEIRKIDIANNTTYMQVSSNGISWACV